VGFAEIRKVDSGFVTVERACHVDTPPSGPQVRLDDAVPRSMPETVSTLSMSKDGTTVHFRRGEVVLVAGSKLDNPESDPLPTSADDPRLFDQDGDGNPGITAHIKAAVFVKGDAYLTQRIRSSHAGTVDAKGVFRGIPRLSAEQSIVGASNPVLKANLALGPEYDAPENLSLLVPVEPGADCDAIMARRAELFGEEP
jgi:hypothetical protein